MSLSRKYSNLSTGCKKFYWMILAATIFALEIFAVQLSLQEVKSNVRLTNLFQQRISLEKWQKGTPALIELLSFSLKFNFLVIRCTKIDIIVLQLLCETDSHFSTTFYDIRWHKRCIFHCRKLHTVHIFVGQPAKSI